MELTLAAGPECDSPVVSVFPGAFEGISLNLREYMIVSIFIYKEPEAQRGYVTA